MSDREREYALTLTECEIERLIASLDIAALGARELRAKLIAALPHASARDKCRGWREMLPSVPANVLAHRDRIMRDLGITVDHLEEWYYTDYRGPKRSELALRMREELLPGGIQCSTTQIAAAIGYRTHTTVVAILHRARDQAARAQRPGGFHVMQRRKTG